MKRILSLGAGVQSTTVALMSAYGELERIDACVFADTWEPIPVYRHLSWLIFELGRHGIPVFVTGMNEQLTRRDPARLPLYLINGEGNGTLFRSCTHRYKIERIEPWIRKFAGIKRGQGAPPVVEHWFGISTDEIRRTRFAREEWKTNYYPLIDLRMDRHACERYNREHVPHPVPRSACIICPYRSNDEWRWLRDNSPEDFATACQFDDEVIRNLDGVDSTAYLHRDRVPLREADLSTLEDHGQQSLFGEDCAGICGV